VVGLEGRALLSATASVRVRVSAAETVLHNFGAGAANDGTQPWGSLTMVQRRGPAVVFGQTRYGGASGDGTLFMMNPNGSGYRVVYSFAGGPNDGSQPMYDQLRQQGSALYGTTLRGGPANQGVIYKLNTSGTGFTLIHRFQGGAGDGAQPQSSPLPIGSKLYGTTTRGGSNNLGTLYAVGTGGTNFHILYSFSTPSGSQPGGFVVKVGNALYGMTRLGGVKNNGVLFRYNLKTGAYTLLHSFVGGANDGAAPDHGGLTVVGNRFYGLTAQGGPANKGVLFRIDISGKQFKVVHDFTGAPFDGASPRGSLVLSGSVLYGTTASGGPGGHGTVFRFLTRGQRFRVLHAFRGAPTDGATALDNVSIYKGNLYGMTRYGGSVPTAHRTSGEPSYANGVIYRMPPSG
jgi:uncharacterized repeat protein (TIGR03803 family)